MLTDTPRPGHRADLDPDPFGPFDPFTPQTPEPAFASSLPAHLFEGIELDPTYPVKAFDYTGVGLFDAIRHAGFDIRYNRRSHRHEVRPVQERAEGLLHPDAKPWPGGWLHLDEGAEAKLRDLLAARAQHLSANKRRPEKYSPTDADFARCMKAIRNDHKSDPWLQWLEAYIPEWDRIPRIDTMAHDCWGVLDNDPDVDPRLVAQWGRSLINALASRMMEPGNATEAIAIMTGLEGRGKSLGLKFIFPPVWQSILFSDALDFNSLCDSKLTIEKTAGIALAEIAEMNDLDKRHLDSVKSGITREYDRARLAYDRHTSDVPRQFVIASTSNNDAPLPDDVSNRRFLPLRCSDDCTGERVIAYMAQNREQLWAEALHTSRQEPLRHLIPHDLKTAHQEHNAGAVNSGSQIDGMVDAIGHMGCTAGTLAELVVESGYFTRSSKDSDGGISDVPLSASEVAEKLDRSLATKLGIRLRRDGWLTPTQAGKRKGPQIYRHPDSREPGFDDGP